MDLYTILGVKKDATLDEIKKAHRELAKKHHPDRGGDEEEFRQIQHAYEILSDPEKRDYYDTTGHELKNDTSFEQKFAELLQRVILPMLMDARDYATRDLIGFVQEVLGNADKNIKANVTKYGMDGSQLTNLKETRKRIKAKEEGRNLFLEMLDSTIAAMERERQEKLLFWQEEQRFNDKAIEELNRYEYEYKQTGRVTVRIGPGHTGAFNFGDFAP